MDPFQILPGDVWGLILFDTHPRKLFRLCRVSKRARTVVHNVVVPYILRRRCGVTSGGIAEFRHHFQCGLHSCGNLDYFAVNQRCRGHQTKPVPAVIYTPVGAIAAGPPGGLLQQIANDGRHDRMLMATDLLNQRIRQIEAMRARQHPDD